MRVLKTLALSIIVGCLTASAANAACEGSNGRGWGKGRGAGKFEMNQADKNCRISFPGFTNDTTGKRIPGDKVVITSKPKNGDLTVVAGKGLIYTPKAGFKGKDKFCTINTSDRQKKGKLQGCVTVSVK